MRGRKLGGDAQDLVHGLFPWGKVVRGVAVGVVDDEQIDRDVSQGRAGKHSRVRSKVASVQNAPKVSLEQEHGTTRAVISVDQRCLHPHLTSVDRIHDPEQRSHADLEGNDPSFIDSEASEEELSRHFGAVDGAATPAVAQPLEVVCVHVREQVGAQAEGLPAVVHREREARHSHSAAKGS